MEEPEASASLKRPKGRPSKISKRNKRKGPFDLSVSDDEGEPSMNDTLDPSLLKGGTQDEFMPQVEDEPMEDELMQQEGTMQSIEGEEPLYLPMEDQVEPDATAGAMPPPAVPKPKRGGRGTSKAAIQDLDESALAISAPEPKKRGRPGRKPQVHEDTDIEQASAPKPARGKRKAPFTERDPNIKMKAARKISKPASRAGSVALGSSSYIVQRSETPATDSGAFTTRSGRTSIKPLATWRGEKAIFGQRPSMDTLGGIQEVVRTDEVMAPPKRINRGYRGPRRARAGTAQSLRDIEEEDEELEQWEIEAGIQQAMVMQWNPEIGKYDEDNTEQLGMPCTSSHSFSHPVLSYPNTNLPLKEIAFAADAIEMRDIQNATFKFAKTLTLPFFGAGMVHLPPGGEKRIKNSRKMQMVFFVFFGRVTVNVGTPTTTFSIGKGGQWQVPRGM